jgi:transposase InsO family protein
MLTRPATHRHFLGIGPPRLSAAGTGHKIYPYLLRGVTIQRPDQVWSTDITYVPMVSGFMYLAAVIDWYSRYVIAWRLSNTLDGAFCLEMLEEALRSGKPEVFNTDQGVQFTAEAFTGVFLGRCHHLPITLMVRRWQVTQPPYHSRNLRFGKR